jgi:hypothetical protein
MTKPRKSPTILKPLIDEEKALRFAAAGSGQAPEPSTDGSPKSVSKRPAANQRSGDFIEKDMRRIALTVSKNLYDRIVKEAARKNRTVEEHLQRHLAKRYDK